jgi:hypothetical protein
LRFAVNQSTLFKRTWSSKTTAKEIIPSQNGIMVHLSNQSNAKESSDLLGNGESCRSIARQLHHSHSVVEAVAKQEWAQVSARKERIAAQSELIANEAAERLLQSVRSGQIKGSALVPVYGVAVDKALALRADYTIRVDHQHQHIHAHITPMSVQDILAKLPRRNPQAEPPRITADPPGNPDALPSGEATSSSRADTPPTAT